MASMLISRPGWALVSSSRTQWVCTIASWLRREAMRRVVPAINRFLSPAAWPLNSGQA
jgi:hypothetical protein